MMCCYGHWVRRGCRDREDLRSQLIQVRRVVVVGGSALGIGGERCCMRRRCGGRGRQGLTKRVAIAGARRTLVAPRAAIVAMMICRRHGNRCVSHQTLGAHSNMARGRGRTTAVEIAVVAAASAAAIAATATARISS